MINAPPIHFLFNDDEESASLAQRMINDIGQTPIEDAKVVVTIGGDGLLLDGLRLSSGKTVCGLTAPGSNSKGFWTNHDLHDPQLLVDALGYAHAYPIAPLRATITFTDGNQQIVHAFNDVVISGRTNALPAEITQKNAFPHNIRSFQSCLLSLKTQNKVFLPRMMGSGMIIATQIGSTGMNAQYGGEKLDIRTGWIASTCYGVSSFDGDTTKNIHPPSAQLVVTNLSPQKRPVMMRFDSYVIEEGEAGALIKQIEITPDQSRANNLTLTGETCNRIGIEASPK